MARIKKVETEKPASVEATARPSGVPSWVSEGSVAKYNRAVKQLRVDGKAPAEEAVKELYIKSGGLIRDAA